MRQVAHKVCLLAEGAAHYHMTSYNWLRYWSRLCLNHHLCFSNCVFLGLRLFRIFHLLVLFFFFIGLLFVSSIYYVLDWDFRLASR